MQRQGLGTAGSGGRTSGTLGGGGGIRAGGDREAVVRLRPAASAAAAPHLVALPPSAVAEPGRLAVVSAAGRRPLSAASWGRMAEPATSAPMDHMAEGPGTLGGGSGRSGGTMGGGTRVAPGRAGSDGGSGWMGSGVG
jgi:hypothetical protein